MTDPDLTRAVILWTGKGLFYRPRRDDKRVLDEFGESGVDLVQSVLALEDDFYWSDAHRKVGDLTEMGEQAAADFRERHPEVGEAAVDALAWCYAYDWK